MTTSSKHNAGDAASRDAGDAGGRGIDAAGGRGARFGGHIQIALAPHAAWGCSATAVPPKECCLPVPGGAISGCHQENEQRWHFNQFFAVVVQPPSAALRGHPPGAPAPSTLFQLTLKSNSSLCATGSGGQFGRAPCEAGGAAQMWSVVPVPSGGALLKHEASGSCVRAVGAHEAGAVAMGPCDVASIDSAWSPLCPAGAATNIPGWPCVGRAPSPPAPPAPPAPPHPPHPSPPPKAGGAVVTAPCGPATVGWQEFEGFWMVTPPSGAGAAGSTPESASATASATATGRDGPKGGSCLHLDMPSFCDGTVCPHDLASVFTPGTGLAAGSCVNGDRSQLFAAYTLPTPATPTTYRENFIPLTWAVSAYVGNGLVGARVESEEGGLGVVHVLIDNVKLGAMGHRKANGYFRFTIGDPRGGPYTVRLHQSIHTSLLTGNVTDHSGT